MEKILHKEFMTGNKLESSDFSKNTQKMEGIYDELHAKRKETTGEARKILDKHLKEFDLEIYDNMLNEMEDQLENNEVIEEKSRLKKGERVEITRGHTQFNGVVGVVSEYHDPSGKNKESVTVEAREFPQGKALYSVSNLKATQKKPSAPPKKEPTNEDILDQIWDKGWKKGLRRSSLMDCGIRHELRDWTIEIGKYILRRTSVFSYKYDLEKVN